MDANPAGGFVPSLLWPLIAGLLFFGCGLVGIRFIDPLTLTAYVWPASGVTIGVLALVAVERWPPYLAGIGVASVAVSLVHGDSIGMALGFTAIELVSSGAAAWGWQRLQGCPPRFESLRAVATFFFIAALGGAVVSGTAGAALLAMAKGARYAAAWGEWVTANAVGTLLIAPALIAWAAFRPKRSGGMMRRDFLPGSVFFVLLVITLFIVFDPRVVNRLPEYVRLALTYLPEPFVVLTALAWGVRGGTLALLALSIVSLISMSHGDGHFISQTNGVAESIYELQLYLAITALMALLIAAMRTEQERALRESDAWRVRYETAAAATDQAVFDIDPASGAIVWSGNVERVLGTSSANLASIDALTSRVEGAARARLRLMFDALRASDADAHTTTIVWPHKQGAMLVEFVARAITDFDGTVYRIAGMARVAPEAAR
jgi:integral membrane sensor domain MASE1